MIRGVNLPSSEDINTIKTHYSSCSSIHSDKAELVVDPFKVLKLRNILSLKHHRRLLKEVDQLELERKDNDLYSLKQSDDLQNVSLPAVTELINLLKCSVRPCLEQILGYEFDDKISVTASLYEEGDVLLCHDDKCEDRCVAFVYYLTDAGDSDLGGHFDMFEADENGQPSKVSFSIPAESNSFICFEVGNYTYHQVREVGPGFRRQSINGWFHAGRALSIPPLPYLHPPPPLLPQKPLLDMVLLVDLMNNLYCTPRSMEQMRQVFTDTSQILLDDFFLAGFFKKVRRQLDRPSVKWSRVGPANRRKYWVAELETLPSQVSRLVDLLVSPLFVHYLRSITGLDLLPQSGLDSSDGRREEGEGRASRIRLEVQRWSAGCYSMATDTDVFFKSDGLDLFIFSDDVNTDTTGGQTTYLASDPDPEEDSELLTLDPRANALAAVYRTRDTVRFTKYLNSDFKSNLYTIAATYYEVTP